jgi:hypothetical protein
MPLSPPAAAKEGMARACAAMRARESEGVTKKARAQDHVAVCVAVLRGAQP